MMLSYSTRSPGNFYFLCTLFWGRGHQLLHISLHYDSKRLFTAFIDHWRVFPENWPLSKIHTEFLSVSLKITNLLRNVHIVTCLRHAAIVETQKSGNTLRNRGSGVFSVPCRAEPSRTVRCYTTGRDDVTRHHARFQGNSVVNKVTRQQSWLASFRCFWLYKRSA
jgi:hypothetical protein